MTYPAADARHLWSAGGRRVERTTRRDSAVLGVAPGDPVAELGQVIVGATRADREPWFETHLVDLADQLTRLGRALDPAGRGRHRQTTGNLLWATLRGLALAQMVVREPMDFSYELRALVDLLTLYLDSRE